MNVYTIARGLGTSCFSLGLGLFRMLAIVVVALMPILRTKSATMTARGLTLKTVFGACQIKLTVSPVASRSSARRPRQRSLSLPDPGCQLTELPSELTMPPDVVCADPSAAPL
jgi:hypothetical protein